MLEVLTLRHWLEVSAYWLLEFDTRQNYKFGRTCHLCCFFLSLAEVLEYYRYFVLGIDIASVLLRAIN